MSWLRRVDPVEKPDPPRDRSYYSLTTEQNDAVWGPEDPEPAKEYWENKWKRVRLSFGYGDGKFISDMTPEDSAIFEYQNRVKAFWTGSVLSLVFLSGILAMIFLNSRTFTTEDLSISVMVVAALVIGSVAYRLKIHWDLEDRKKGIINLVAVPNCVVDVSGRYLSVIFKGTPDSEEYIIYYDQIKKVVLPGGKYRSRRIPDRRYGMRKIRPGLDPRGVNNALCPKTTPEDYIIDLVLKERTTIEPRKVMTLHFQSSAFMPGKVVRSENVLISIRPDEQTSFLKMMNAKLDDGGSFDGQELYPEWN